MKVKSSQWIIPTFIKSIYIKPKNALLVACILTASGCEINKPVPIEQVPTVASQSRRPQTPVNNSARRPAPPAQASTHQQQQAWSPINIQPLDATGIKPAMEPTQPITEYEFKPHPKSRDIKSQASNTRRQQPNTQANREVYGSQLDQYDWDTKNSTISDTAAATRVHRVSRGENLYAIARNYDISVKLLARLNDLQPPYAIYPKQELVISGQLIAKNNLPAQPDASIDTSSNTSITWSWPAHGKILAHFSSSSKKGIEIGGSPGDSIRATAEGKVLYAGDEVTGYGSLIILEHTNGYISTYAHNRKLLVRNDELVKKGQTIAEMGSTDTDVTKLFFEIRKNEIPVNPEKLLPKI